MFLAKTASCNRFTPPAPYPGTGDIGAFKRLTRMARSQIDGLPRAVYEQDAWQPPLPGMPLFVMSPELVRTILLDDAEDFRQGDLFARIMRPVWGEGLLLAQNDAWKMQRRATAQAFRTKDMAALIPHFVQSAERTLARWRVHGSEPTDLLEDMKQLTFDVIVDTMLSGLSGAEEIDRDTLRQNIGGFFADVSKLRMSYVFRDDAYHAHRPSQDSPYRDEIISFMKRLIASRRAAPPRGDLVDLLMSAQDPETGEPLSDVQLADNLLGFILAGHETTAVALTWTVYLVASHAPTEVRLLDELETALGGNPVGPEHADSLPFAKQVISEALRIYPPAFLLTRVAARDRMLGPHKLKTGERVNIPIWAIHRQARHWPNPHVFDPDRFVPDRPPPDRCVFMPFGAGPRICIGASFALIEMLAVLATLIRRVEIMPPPRETVWPETGLALTPKGGMKVRIKERPKGQP